MEARVLAEVKRSMQAAARVLVALLVLGSVAGSRPEPGHAFPFSCRATAVATYLVSL
jgi:hypothetical protein